MCEDLLFCTYVRKRVAAEELFKILDCFLTENGLKWENSIGACSDGTQTMSGMRKGLRAIIKKVSPNAGAGPDYSEVCWSRSQISHL